MIQLEKANTANLKHIAEMAHSIWKAYYIEFLPEEQIDYMLEKFYALPALEQQVADGQNFYIIKDNHADAGFVAISKKTPSEYFIHKMYIYPELHGKHIGSDVIKRITEMICMDENHTEISNIRLTVNRQNFKAVNFYFRNGFRIEKVEDFDIGNSFYMNDFVMLKTIKCH